MYHDKAFWPLSLDQNSHLCELTEKIKKHLRFDSVTKNHIRKQLHRGGTCEAK